MAENIYAKPDMSKKVRYKRNVQEDRGAWEEREVEIYESTDAVRDDHADNQSHGAGPETERRPPAVQRKTFRAAAVCLAVLCFLMMTGIILLSVYFISLHTENKQLSKNNTQLQEEVKQLKNRTEATLLQTRYDQLSNNYTQLQDEVKQLKDRTEVTLLQTRYDQLSNNYTQLQDEVKQLKDRTEVLKICPDGWTRSGRSCYFKSKEKKNWDNSRADCQQRGADLVVIDNEEEQKFVSELSNGGQSWIGLRYGWGQGEGTWRPEGWEWVDGSPLRETFWGPGPPQYGHGSYAACCDQGKWKQSHYHTKTWICEKKMI
ncbi:LOW QUALITY PROTEIN: asialoglycoprotein receptor 1-like [Etheostoma spectabile]|uniref:LOW QUALITY PROTEIN: asialoglycoprotein receptor 1-like n=1 Tax=Etheostoma spectabile TaxID=54343 RepID=UPI0013AF20EA|nr:LOW QUALITY PROTEIN: asialoglycoprotein receptor 1-like [Etheostoma spectabile]